jgi:hypothetical protein
MLLQHRQSSSSVTQLGQTGELFLTLYLQKWKILNATPKHHILIECASYGLFSAFRYGQRWFFCGWLCQPRQRCRIIGRLHWACSMCMIEWWSAESCRAAEHGCYTMGGRVGGWGRLLFLVKFPFVKKINNLLKDLTGDQIQNPLDQTQCLLPRSPLQISFLVNWTRFVRKLRGH